MRNKYNSMDPMWTREVKLPQRKLDPLGLSRVSQWLTEELLPGITTVTSVARNYSFYAWGISNLLKMNKITQRSQFARELTKREAAFVIGCILHEASKPNRLNPHGYDKATRFIKKTNDGKIQVEFNVSESNPEGFYGLYYRTAMFKLGLTIRSRLFDDLTPLGRQLAAAFESNIKDADYFKYHIQNDEVNKEILANYGEKVCICRLVVPSKERELLRSVMFSDNLPFLNLERSRKESLLLVLSLIRQSSDFGIEFTSDTFRDAIFFGQATDGKSIFDLNFKNFEEITARWHLFQLHEYFTFAMESLLHALLNELKKRDEGMSFDDFLSMVGMGTSISEALKISSTGTIKETIGLLLKNYHLSELNSDASHQFDRLCNLEKEVSEKELFGELQRAIKDNNLEKTLGNAIAILILNYIRAYHLLDDVDVITLWFTNRALQEFSSASFAQNIRSKTSTWMLDDLIRYCFKVVRDQHDSIALDKLLYGNDTYRFEEKGNRLKFKMDVYPNYPSQRSSKISSVLAILEQLGLIETHGNIKRLTHDGSKILEDWLHARAS